MSLVALSQAGDSHQGFVIRSDFEDVKIVFSINEVLNGAVLVRHSHHGGEVLATQSHS